MEKKNKRRQYLIDPSFQLQFVFKFCLVVIISSLVIGCVLFLVTQDSTTVAIENTRVNVKSTSDFILPGLTATLLIVSFFAALVVLIIALFASHKISGPIFRLTREISLLKDGGLSRNFNIRNQDQLQTLATSLDEMAGSLKLKHAEVSESFQKLKTFLEEKDFTISDENTEQLRQIVEELEDRLNFFKYS